MVQVRMLYISYFIWFERIHCIILLISSKSSNGFLLFLEYDPNPYPALQGQCEIVLAQITQPSQTTLPHLPQPQSHCWPCCSFKIPSWFLPQGLRNYCPSAYSNFFSPNFLTADYLSTFRSQLKHHPFINHGFQHWLCCLQQLSALLHPHTLHFVSFSIILSDSKSDEFFPTCPHVFIYFPL